MQGVAPEEMVLYKKGNVAELNIDGLKVNTDLRDGDKLKSAAYKKLENAVEKNPTIKYKSYVTTGLTLDSVYSNDAPIIFHITVSKGASIGGDSATGSKSLNMLLPRNSSIKLTDVALLEINGKQYVKIYAEAIQ